MPTFPDNHQLERLLAESEARCAALVAREQLLEDERARTDKELREREAFLRTSQETGHFGSWEVDLATSRTKWSGEFCRIYGLALDEFEGSFGDNMKYIHPDDQDHIRARVQLAIETRQQTETEYRIIRPDGEERVIWVRGGVVIDGAGRPTKLIGTALDITDRKRTEKALHDSEALMRGLVETSPIPMLVVTVETNHRVVSMNRKFTEVFGYTLDDIPDVNAWWPRAYPDPEYRQRIQQLWSGALAAAERADASSTAPVEALVTCRDGSRRYVETHVGRCGDQALVLFNDLTERKRAEESLRESESFLRISQQASHCGSWEWELASGRVKWSDELCRIHGLMPGEFGGQLEDSAQFFHPDDERRMRESFQLLLTTHEANPAVYRIVRRDGTERVLWGRGEVLFGPDGQAERAIGTVVDLTEQKQAEETLQRIIEAITPITGPNFFHSLANHLAQACEVEYAFIGTIDQTDANLGRSIAVSHGGQLVDNFSYDLRGTPCEQVVGKTMCHYRSGVQQEFPLDVQLVEMGIDSYMGIPLFSSTGKALGLMVLMHDRPIPQSKQAEAILRVVAARASAELERELAEKALRESEARHSAILESSLDGLVVFEESGEVADFNAAAEVMFGHRREDVIGRNVADLIMPAALSNHHGRDLLQYVTSRTGRATGQRIEMPAVRASGAEFRVELSLVPIGGTEPLLFAGVVRDITERLRLEDQLRQSQKMQAIGQLAGGVAHDFNNLLTVIMGYSDVLLADMSPAHPLFEAATNIHDAGERASLLTRQLLLFGRKALLEPHPLDLNVVLQHTGKMLRRLIGEDVTIHTTLDPSLSHTRVDRGQMEQVIVNLCLNSRDAMPRGGRLAIETHTVRFDDDDCQVNPDYKPGRFVELMVRDTGCGLTADVRAHLFEPFFTTKGPGKGTGLGLATVYGIVQQSGGFITVCSELNVGTTFRVFLPAIASDAPAQPDVAPSPAAGRETILLVEDEEGVRRLARRSLEKHGYTVLEASSGHEAIALAGQTGRIDALVTDVVMAGMNGREVAERLCASRPELKVLFMSGYNDDEVIRHGIVESFAFLQKPFDLQMLAKKVRDVIDHAG